MRIVGWFLKICASVPERLQYVLGDIYAHTRRPFVYGGRRFRRYWKSYSRTERAPRRELEALQWQKLKRLLSHASRNVPFYRRRFREAGVSPDEVASFEDLLKIPLLTKEDVREHLDELIADGVDRKKLICNRTGGSTGTPLEVYYDGQQTAARYAVTVRWKKFAGCDGIRDRLLYLGSVELPPGTDSTLFRGLYYPMRNELRIAPTNMTPTVLDEYVRRIRTFKPRYIQGPAGGIYVLACHLRSHGIDDIHVDAVLASGDALLPHKRNVIEEVFRLKVFERYGMVEETAQAMECELHDGMHLDMETCMVEILDEAGRHVFDRTGEIIATSLENYAMPFIRYRTRDLGRVSRRMCPCGRESLMLEALDGRQGEMLLTPDGRRIGTSSFNLSLQLTPALRECQFVQTSIDRVTVNVVPWKEWTGKDTEDFLARLRTQLGSAIGIEIRTVDSIPRTSGGKLRLLVSSLDAATTP